MLTVPRHLGTRGPSRSRLPAGPVPARSGPRLILLPVAAATLVLLLLLPGAASAQFPATGAPYHEADVRFMQDMIHHHAQALIMARMVDDRTDRRELRLLAQRIDRSQDDEIRIMTRWLEDRGEDVPEVRLYDPLVEEHGDHGHHDHEDHAGHHDHHHHGHHHTPAHHGHEDHGDQHAHHDHSDMAGMLSDEELDRLAAASGAEFERLFLQFMIFHHEGALIMVEDLFATPGAGQESDIFQFASHVDSDQRMEIVRMLRLLRETS